MLTISKPRVAVFPEFQPLSEDVFNFYQAFTYPFPQHCDFSLNNLIVWFGANNTRISWLNKNLVLEINEALYSNQLDGSWYTILGNKHHDKTLDKFFSAGLTDKLEMVPDYFADGLKKTDRWHIEEDVNNRDYILDIEVLLNKRGKIYDNFRYQISYFLKNHSADARLHDINLQDPAAQAEIIESLRSWHINSFFEDGNDRERVDEKAIMRLLEFQGHLLTRHRCIGLYINDKLAGFSIFHVPPSKDLIGLGNHIKFDGQYKRMFDFLVFATASRLKTEGIKLLNAEQDMGLHGIRHHKKYLNPVGFYKKYTISC